MPIEQRVVNAPQRPGGAATGGIRPRPAEAAPPEEPAPKSRKKLVVVLVAVVVLLAAAAFYVVGLPDGDGEPPAPEAGEVFVIEPMSINLAGGHYLRLGLGLQLTSDADDLDSAMARDAAIALFSGKTVEEVSDPAGRDALKQSLSDDLWTLYDGEVMGLYWTDFVTQ